MITEQSSIGTLTGVGPKRQQLFEKLGIHTVGDLLRHYPRSYEDWSNPIPVLEAPVGEPCCIRAVPLSLPRERRVRAGMTLYQFTVHDGENELAITLFNNRFAAEKIRLRTPYLFYGTVTGNFLRREMSAPLIEPAETGAKIRPLYPLTAGLSSRMVETAVRAAMQHADPALWEDPLPASLRQKYDLISRREAWETIHFPTDMAAVAKARRRLIFEELLVLQLGLMRLKGCNSRVTGVTVTRDATEAFLRHLPFAPTGAQRRAMDACVADMRRGIPMNRLLQGDVGSGKTAVAAGVAFTVIQNGFQAVMMAPTEILARQHYESLSALLAPAGVTVGLLTGSLSAAEKRRVLAGLSDGSIHLAVGTHALLTETVAFDRLGLVITDEQHRFGVAQRAALAAKGANPHLLVMSATPIPRTLALMIYGDLDVSVLDELPPGRKPVATYAVGSDKRERAYNYVKKHLDVGRQAYVVCPLVEENEALDLKSAQAMAQSLADGPLRGYSVGLLHGQMKGTDKDRVMAQFAAGELAVLVSTTVIEVGVNVPNAVIMVVENAERFGLAQLHQLRGRVGRGEWQSSCILISDAGGDEAKRRLTVMCETNDGFKIADEDLKLRGPGDFFGNRQHGLPEMKIADLSGDMTLLSHAQDAARALHAADPTLCAADNAALCREVQRLFALTGENGLN